MLNPKDSRRGTSILANHISDKIVVCRIHKELLKQ